ncbi:MAG: NAD(+)/NADH kinase [Clostridia bacterium]|nr:NAD(+)/NADH kinase [Clostridia bacterium]
MMVRVGVITNIDKDVDFIYTKKVVECIVRKGGEVKVSSDIADSLGIENEGMDEEAVFESSDIIICLGGDGTFLRVARTAYKFDTPILGINLGSLGFLTEVEKNDIDKAVEYILQGKYSVEERIMLEGTVIRDDKVIEKEVALNDIVISRAALSRILHLKTYINDMFVDSFPGDGLIISSPTGSTAYSLSAGGPIVEPDTELIIVTPICPHILYSRTFIATGDRIVRVAVDEKYCHDAMVTIDGQKGYNLRGGDIIEIKKASQVVKMIKVSSVNFFNILRAKIYDRGEILRKNEV